MMSRSAHSGRVMLSAVVPTKNRAEDLTRVIRSVCAQIRPPDEVVIVDQSTNADAGVSVRSLLEADPRISLTYIHDTSISGLVEAKRVGARRSTREIVCFLEDDVVLEADYVAEIVRGFEQCPDMLGCSGVITNQPSSSRIFVALHGLCFRGIFRDPRVGIFSRAKDTDRLIVCDVLSGGLSAWRRELFEAVDVDSANGFFMLEDIEFSTRVVRHFGHRLYVNTEARLEHRWSPVNRTAQGARQRRKLTEAFVYYKKRRGWPGARVGLLMAMVWWWGEAVLQTARNRSLGPVKGYWRGVADGLRQQLAEEAST
jgi:GT2 family glycosyltransferase